VVITVSDAPIEIDKGSIRAKNQDSLARQTPAQNLPKNLFACVRRKAYPNILEKGILAGSFPMVVLSSDKKMAERIGKRRDHEPVMLTINTHKTTAQGVFFFQTGEIIFTAKFVPPNCFTGPLLPKQKAVTIKPGQKVEGKLNKTAGTFTVDLEDRNEKQKRRAGKKRRNEVGWKEDRKKMRKGKHRS